MSPQAGLRSLTSASAKLSNTSRTDAGHRRRRYREDTVLTKRIARLVREGHARPDEILAVTYTKNAAQEMRQRVGEELRGTDLSGLQIATFHEYCNELLRENGQEFGVVDEQDLWIYLRRASPRTEPEVLCPGCQRRASSSKTCSSSCGTATTNW